MIESLGDQSVAVQVVAYAYIALFAFALVVAIGASIVGRFFSRPAKHATPIAAVFGAVLLVGVPGGIAAALALLVTPLLVAMPLPLAGWLLIACMCLYGFYEVKQRPGEGMEGCTTWLIATFAGFGLCWCGAAILLADPPVGNAASFVRPLLIAAPPALFVAKHTSRNRVRQAIGFGLVIAILVAIAFLPVEQGFAGEYLPASDWLRFPIAGAVVFAAFPLLAIPLGLIFGTRAINLRSTFRSMAMLGLIGASLGLGWAFTRLLF
jgi:hypothetical protein